MPDDADAISALIRSLAHVFTLHPQGVGAEGFLQTLQPAAIETLLRAPQFSCFTGHADDELAGVVAVRDNRHLHYLFVSAAFQGRGFGRLLWEHARQVAVAAGNREGFTVNSTPYALPVYQRFGFQATGPRTEMKGIAFIPMSLAH